MNHASKDDDTEFETSVEKIEKHIRGVSNL